MAPYEALDALSGNSTQLMPWCRRVEMHEGAWLRNHQYPVRMIEKTGFRTGQIAEAGCG